MLAAWAPWADSLPERGSTSAAIMRLPARPGVPQPLAGRTVLAVRFAWIGDPAAGEHAVATIAATAPVVLGGTRVTPYTALGTVHADPVDPMPTHDDALLLGELPPAAVDTLLGWAGPGADCPQLVVELRRLGGALSRAPAHPSAVCHRDAAHQLFTVGVAPPGTPAATRTRTYATVLLDAMHPWSDGARPINFGTTRDPATLASRYDPATRARLAGIADRYDPLGLLPDHRAVRAAVARPD